MFLLVVLVSRFAVGVGDQVDLFEEETPYVVLVLISLHVLHISGHDAATRTPMKLFVHNAVPKPGQSAASGGHTGVPFVVPCAAFVAVATTVVVTALLLRAMVTTHPLHKFGQLEVTSPPINGWLQSSTL